MAVIAVQQRGLIGVKNLGPGPNGPMLFDVQARIHAAC
jgi:hypothetical protein